MATIAIPTSPGFQTVSIQRRNRSAISVSPWSMVQQAQRLPGSLWVAQFNLPPMATSDAYNWIGFLNDLEGMSNTFNYNPNDLTLGSAGPGLIAWRLTSDMFEYSISTAMHFGIQFEAMEAK